MPILKDEELKKAIEKYKKNHPRKIEANFEGEIKTYETEQVCLDIIETLEYKIKSIESNCS